MKENEPSENEPVKQNRYAYQQGIIIGLIAYLVVVAIILFLV